MKYKRFKNIEIDNYLGVSPVGKDTFLMAEKAAKLIKNSALEIGSGTGFITTYLAKLGYKCSGVDINPLAIFSSKRNAKKNNLKINYYESNLFSNVKGRYELLIFNPPYGNSNSKYITVLIEIVKSLLPKENKRLAIFSFKYIKAKRRELIRKFLFQSKRHLNPKGKILIYLHPSEFDLFAPGKVKKLGAYLDLDLVLLSRLS